ncbi:MAG: twin-arginine translocase subunit TatC, partial [Phycisphaerae bacterium]
ATGPAGGSETMVVPTVNDDPPHPADGQLWFNQVRNELRIYQDGRVRIVTLTAPAAMIPLIDPNDYINEVTWLSLVIVIIFHVPVVMAFLGMVGFGNPDWLAKKRKFVVFGLFVAAIFFTPSQDLFSNVMIPLLAWGLFELGLLLMRMFARRRQNRLADEE